MEFLFPKNAKDILEKFKMLNSNPVSTPVECGVKLSKHDDEENVNTTFLRVWLEG